MASIEARAQFIIDYARPSLGGKLRVNANITGATNVSRFNVYEKIHATGSTTIRIALTSGGGYSGTWIQTIWSGSVTGLNAQSTGGGSATLESSQGLRTYYIVPNTMSFNDVDGFIASATTTGNSIPVTYSVLEYNPSNQLINSTEVELITLNANYVDGVFDSGTGDTTNPNDPVDPEDPTDPPLDSELTALGLELPDGYEPSPGDTIDLQITNLSGETSNLTVDAQSIMDNMTFSLEGIVLGEGDSISFNNTEWESPIQGTIQTDWKEGLVWTDNNTTLLNSSGLVGGTTGTYTTSTTTSGGSTIVSNTEYDTSTNTVSTTKTKSEPGLDSIDGITYAEDLAGALEAAAKGKADGMAEGSAANSELYAALQDELGGLTVLSDDITGKAQDIVLGKDPYANAPGVSSSSYSMSLPTPWGPVNYTVNPNEGWMQVIRAIEYVILAIMGFRLFFKILIV